MSSDICARFGKRLREHRKARGWSAGHSAYHKWGGSDEGGRSEKGESNGNLKGKLPDPEEALTRLNWIHIDGRNTVGTLSDARRVIFRNSATTGSFTFARPRAGELRRKN